MELKKIGSLPNHPYTTLDYNSISIRKTMSSIAVIKTLDWMDVGACPFSFWSIVGGRYRSLLKLRRSIDHGNAAMICRYSSSEYARRVSVRIAPAEPIARANLTPVS